MSEKPTIDMRLMTHDDIDYCMMMKNIPKYAPAAMKMSVRSELYHPPLSETPYPAKIPATNAYTYGAMPIEKLTSLAMKYASPMAVK